MKQSDLKDVVIIGGGAAGLSAGIYLGRAGLAPIIYAGSPPGGQLVLTSEVENYPGHENILGSELIDKMRKQAVKFGAHIIDENVQLVKFDQSDKLVQAIKTKSVIIATGAKALWLGLASEQRLRGKGVSACATCDGFFFKNKIVGVAGGGDTALEEALTLTKFASKVFIIHRRSDFRASKIMQKRVKENTKIEIIWNSTIEEVLGQNRVEGVRLKSAEISSQLVSTDRQLKIDGLFVAIGHKPDTDLFKDMVKFDDKGYIVTTQRAALINFQLSRSNYQSNSNDQLKTENSLKIAKLKTENFDMDYQTATSVRGVFAAGDCVDHIYRQAAVAAGMGVGAALDVENWLEANSEV
ncbi:hypothetical protein A2334_01670 [Candidatus Roizmanbacteria bacterium RIFOXYB2_FULL_38_10]|uniref:FAD/NAD(P)-binding domain-containing protein n=1 Tax=Candidatus Roizmanbacteria bacterium RIFOXYD1_FULL_38_12 TaxID=1802093 RepID=A0A1F7L1T5_9BACT|nr:MAG: hypothetical protein A3K47_04730 [Candidatus Roizmanbacteria bacterium RIFOXYA2_FULL_38_14]OGK64056.1 MAG: hypothetical protein A3K27_04730 [Candidatus Roizmanbacteria bacterium RIFOXYA1_FULL_37_12]OGK65902.1 MAG: hypothetical protein A3K38_04730 [Candidatus Roizmanbacteria bacterium RIFOXYB1_FULL_40_23]OGK68055.1 MAG: hypothetical protein A2334_01670 [Candidatus Roizmanbacteria bacterium RIFOXYB2_FULL_38_10]OGK70307.1 MAG: hypothetical protein A3K21_04735 [Candidatus Roizmanbacteria ba